MAYKFQRGAATASGSFAAEEGLVSNGVVSGSSNFLVGTTLTVGGQGTFNNGLQVTSGATILQATTASAINVSTINGNFVNNLTNNSLPRWISAIGQFADSLASSDAVTGKFTVSGSTGLIVTGSTSITNGLTVVAGGAVVSAGTTAVQALTATTISGSSTLQVGSSATIANGLTVTAGGLTISAGDSSVQKLTVNGDLVVLGSTISASVETLLIQDAAIVVGDGSTTFGSGYGLLFGSGSNQWASLQTAVDGATNVLSSSLPIKATVIGSISTSVIEIGDADATLVNGVNFATASLTATRTWTLPTSPSVGDSVKIKAPSNCGNGVSQYNIVISRAGSQTIDGETSVVLESPYAAVECLYVATNKWSIF